MSSQPEPDSYVAELLRAAPFQTSHISVEDAEFKLAGLERWKWLWDALEKVPDGQCLLIDVPPGHECARMANCIRSAVVMAKKTRPWKWSVRQTKDEKGIVIIRGEMWKQAQTVLEKQRDSDITSPPKPHSTRAVQHPRWDRTGDGKLDELPSPDPPVILELGAAILIALQDDGPCTKPELIDRVEELRPGSKRGSIGTKIFQMLESGHLHQADGAVIHIAAVWKQGNLDVA